MQRLPRSAIERAQEAGKVVFEEHPSTSDFGSWDFACFGSPPQLFRVHPQESSCLDQS